MPRVRLLATNAAMLALLAMLAGDARAGQGVDPCASNMAKPHAGRRDALTGEWGGWRKRLEHDDGLAISLSYAGEAYAATDISSCCVGAGVAALGVDLDLATALHAGLGALHVLGFAIHGDGLTAQLGDIHGVSNNVATPDVRLFEAWYEQPIGPAAIRAGLLSADQEFVIARHGSVFLDATFGVIGQISANLLGPVYPVATPGVSGRIDLGAVAVRAAIYDGDQTNSHGIPTDAGHSALAIGEVELWQWLKLGGWIHTERANGAYAVIDRPLPHRLGWFARVGWSPNGEVALYGDAGVRFGPGGLVRRHDFAGAGVAYSHFTDTMGTVRNEAVAEVTYQIALTGWMTVQPDVQVVFQSNRTPLVGAVRSVIVF